LIKPNQCPNAAFDPQYETISLRPGYSSGLSRILKPSLIGWEGIPPSLIKTLYASLSICRFSLCISLIIGGGGVKMLEAGDSNLYREEICLDIPIILIKPKDCLETDISSPKLFA
jgi:hypothetical protein